MASNKNNDIKESNLNEDINAELDSEINEDLDSKLETSVEALDGINSEFGEDVIIEPKEEKVETEAALIVKEEIRVKSEKGRKRMEKLKAQEKKRKEKEKQKKIRAHRREVKKHDTSIIRYEVEVEKGLTSEIVESRVLDELTNVNNQKTSKSYFQIFYTNIVSFFNLLIFAIAGILISIGAWTDLVFFGMVLVNISVGIYQEINAKKTIDRLSLMSAPSATVRRDGVIREISVEDIVLDDIILLETGKQIGADSIVVDGQIEVNESLLTGESDAIVKKPGDVLYAGSYIVSGKCSARVDKVGKDNYIEKLTSQAKKYKKPKSDLLFSLNLIIKVMGVTVTVIGALLFFIMYVQNKHPYEFSVRKTAGAMVGMIPSGLFLMTSIALAVGVIRLGQKNVLVQELYCIEMLARVNCICLDKTGTITDGTMSVKNVIDYNNVYGLATKNVISAMLNAIQDNNLTSQALQEKFGLGKRVKHLALIPFSSQRKYQAVTFDKFGTFVLGAPEFVLKDDFIKYKKDVDKYASYGYRVLCLAHQDGIIENNELPNSPKLVLSMILIEDNIRPDAINTIKYFRESGVQVRVISGDNPITVSKISQRAGIENAEDYISLDGLSDEEVEKAATKYTVFGRVSPSQKKIIISSLKTAGLTVAMTGDGVNDILALRESDCSIAVASGSEAARNVAHLVLLDSNFDSMPSVVAEGRRVINNITSVASLFLTKTIFSLFLAIQALQTGTYPISTNQLILIDVLCIGLPSLFLVMEPNNNPVKGKFLSNVICKALPGALVILIISIITFQFGDFDSITLSTIIVISATHTCMMVLFKTCRPFNTLRRVLCSVCYALFIFFIVILPQFLEFRPIFSWAQYYKSNITLPDSIVNYPSIEISRDDFYVVDGKYTNVHMNTSTSSTYRLGSAYGTSSDDEFESTQLYYTIDDNRIKKVVEIPSISYTTTGNVYLGGYMLKDIKYTGDQFPEFTINEYGEVFLKENNAQVKTVLTKENDYYDFHPKYGSVKPYEVQCRIMPTVELKSGELIINGGNSTANFKYYLPDGVSSFATASITINPETMSLLINGYEIYATYNDGTRSTNPYKVSFPTITTNGEDIFFNPSDLVSDCTIYEIFGSKGVNVDQYSDSTTTYTLYSGDDKLTYYPKQKICMVNDQIVNSYEFSFRDGDIVGISTLNDANLTPISLSEIKLMADGSNYVFVYNDRRIKSISLDNYKLGIGPNITTSKENFYVIGGYYTQFASSNKDLDPKMDANKNLVIGGVTTDYEFQQYDVIKQTNGIVTKLDRRSIIFLLMLCLLASPLMRIIPEVIPWLKRQVSNIKNLLTKY